MRSPRLDDALVERLYQQANAGRWHVPSSLFAEALETSVGPAVGAKAQTKRELDRYLASLHLEDLALACACAAGDEAAWEHFIREQRPRLYRAADALAPGGRARELADSLYADLYGLDDRGKGRQSLFRYFHGRSSLATWLRAVLAQRYVDRLRAERRVEPLPEEESTAAIASVSTGPPDPDRSRYVTAIRRALGKAVARLDPRDRLRLGCYYAEELTLAETGRVLLEHQATVSRQLARTRRAIRQDVESQLRAEGGMTEPQIAQCFHSVMEDPGPLDVRDMIDVGGERKKSEPDRSQ
jgi:RNA polymerase sigma-70 factor (ECF subfamily)